MTGPASPEIACRQVLQKDYSVFSGQWTVVPAREADRLTAAFLLERYLSHVRRATGSLVRPRRTGGEIEFRLLGLVTLITFAGPHIAAEDGVEVASLRLTGGLLVHPGTCRQGELTFSCEAVAGGVRAGLQLSDYCPLLLGRQPGPVRRWLYRLSQAAIHRRVATRFLLRLQCELAGRRVCCRVTRLSDPGDLTI
jgi:hypothetical protein